MSENVFISISLEKAEALSKLNLASQDLLCKIDELRLSHPHSTDVFIVHGLGIELQQFIEAVEACK